MPSKGQRQRKGPWAEAQTQKAGGWAGDGLGPWALPLPLDGMCHVYFIYVSLNCLKLA